jgi:hypothetical protein
MNCDVGSLDLALQAWACRRRVPVVSEYGLVVGTTKYSELNHYQSVLLYQELAPRR